MRIALLFFPRMEKFIFINILDYFWQVVRSFQCEIVIHICQRITCINIITKLTKFIIKKAIGRADLRSIAESFVFLKETADPQMLPAVISRADGRDRAVMEVYRIIFARVPTWRYLQS